MAVDAVPSPKSQRCKLMTPVEVEDWSVNEVGNPRHAVSAVKLASGNVVIVIIWMDVSEQFDVLNMISETVKVPDVEKI